MRLALSGIAWDPSEDEAVAQLLARYGVDAIDVAPGKYFPDFAATTTDEALALRARWRARGIEVTGMQSLLFGTKGLNLFGAETTRTRMQAHLAEVMRIAGVMAAPRLVFGSPKNRDRGTLDDAAAQQSAIAFFAALGEIAAQHKVLLCLEPNPPRYGCNFMLDAESTARVVRAIGHPHIRMQLDIGALALAGESADAVLAEHADIVGHVHASEPDLVPLGDGAADHAAAARALRRWLPDAVVSIEMVATTNEPHLTSIERALTVACGHYVDAR